MRWPRWLPCVSAGRQLPLVLAGFSFGAAVAIAVAARAQPAWLISVAPAVDRVPLDDFLAPACPWLIVQGEADEVVACEQVRAWSAARASSATLCLLPGVGHFFHGRLHELQDCLADTLARRPRARHAGPLKT